MAQNLAACKKVQAEPVVSGKKLWFKTQKDNLFRYKELGGLQNWLYVLQGLMLKNPFMDHPVTIRPKDFCEEFGKPWESGIMPDRSFRDALAFLKENGLVSVRSKRNGFFKIQVHPRGLFFSPLPAEPCQDEKSGGEILPDRSPEALENKASGSAQTDLDQSYLFKDQDLQNRKQPCVLKNEIFSEEKAAQQSGLTTSQECKKTPLQADISKKTKYSAASAATVENVQAEIRRYGFEVDLRGAEPTVLSSLWRLILETEDTAVKEALAAFWEQKDSVRSPGKFLIKAIGHKWKPSRLKTGVVATLDFKEWFNLANEIGLARGSTLTTEGKQLIYLANMHPVEFETMAQKVPLDWLKDLTQEQRWDLSRLITQHLDGDDVCQDLVKMGVTPHPDTLLQLS